MGAPANINVNEYADEERISFFVGADMANAEIAEAEAAIVEEAQVKFELKEEN